MGIIHPTAMVSPVVLFSLLVSTKEVIRAMDKVISDHVEWDNWDKWSEIMAEFFTADMIYDTNWSPDETMNNSTGIWDWWENEHIPYRLTFSPVRGHTAELTATSTATTLGTS